MKIIFLLTIFSGCISNNIDEVKVNQVTMNFTGDDEGDFFKEVISIKNYKNGKRHGDWFFYHNDSGLVKIEKYKNGELINKDN